MAPGGIRPPSRAIKDRCELKVNARLWRLTVPLALLSGVMPKRGLDVSSCEVFRFYRLIAVTDLVEPLSMIVPRKEVVYTLAIVTAKVMSGLVNFDLLPSSLESSKRTCTQ